MGSQCLALAEPTRGGRWSSLIRKWDGQGQRTEPGAGQVQNSLHHPALSPLRVHLRMPLMWRNLPVQCRVDPDVHLGPHGFLIMRKETRDLRSKWLPHSLQEDVGLKMLTELASSIAVPLLPCEHRGGLSTERATDSPPPSIPGVRGDDFIALLSFPSITKHSWIPRVPDPVLSGDIFQGGTQSPLEIWNQWPWNRNPCQPSGMRVLPPEKARALSDIMIMKQTMTLDGGICFVLFLMNHDFPNPPGQVHRNGK